MYFLTGKNKKTGEQLGSCYFSEIKTNEELGLSEDWELEFLDESEGKKQEKLYKDKLTKIESVLKNAKLDDKNTVSEVSSILNALLKVLGYQKL